MERLTKKGHKRYVCNAPVEVCEKHRAENGTVYCCTCEQRKQMQNKLGELEDLEEQGLLLRLPCKVGDTLYVVGTKCLEYKEPNEYWCNTHSCEECVYDQEYVVFEREATKDLVFTVLMRNNPNFVVGKSVFATKAEAEKVLAEMGCE